MIDEVEDRTATLAATHTDLESEIALLARYEPILQKIQPLARQIVTTGAYDSVALLFERRYKSAIDALKEELDKITHKQYEIVSTDVDEDTTAAIVVFSRQYSDAVHKFLAIENINQIRLPERVRGHALRRGLRRAQGAPQGAARAISTTIRKELDELSKTWAIRLTAIRDVLIDKTAEIEAIPKFGRTEYAFVITGWMPVDDVPALRDGIKAALGRRRHRRADRDPRERVRGHAGRAEERPASRAVPERSSASTACRATAPRPVDRSCSSSSRCSSA